MQHALLSAFCHGAMFLMPLSKRVIIPIHVYQGELDEVTAGLPQV